MRSIPHVTPLRYRKSVKMPQPSYSAYHFHKSLIHFRGCRVLFLSGNGGVAAESYGGPRRAKKAAADGSRAFAAEVSSVMSVSFSASQMGFSLVGSQFSIISI